MYDGSVAIVQYNNNKLHATAIALINDVHNSQGSQQLAIDLM